MFFIHIFLKLNYKIFFVIFSAISEIFISSCFSFCKNFPFVKLSKIF
nr:MAG TPA: hypothetical protein [Bacteriophage sp.]